MSAQNTQFSSYSRYAGRRRALTPPQAQALVSQAIGGEGLKTVVVGLTDDIAGVFSAARAGYCICFTPGTFVFSSTIVISKRMVVDGCGAVLSRAPGFTGPIFDVQADDVVITNVAFDGGAAEDAEVPVITVSNSQSTEVRECEFNNTGRYAVEEIGTSDYSITSDCVFN